MTMVWPAVEVLKMYLLIGNPIRTEATLAADDNKRKCDMRER